MCFAVTQSLKKSFSWKDSSAFTGKTFIRCDSTSFHVNQLQSVLEDLQYVTQKYLCAINKYDLFQDTQLQGNTPQTHLDIALGMV